MTVYVNKCNLSTQDIGAHAVKTARCREGVYIIVEHKQCKKLTKKVKSI